MNNVKARLATLEEALERRKMEQDWPEDDLSKSLREMGRELAGLDTLGKSTLLYELNYDNPLEATMGLDLSMEDLENMIAIFTS